VDASKNIFVATGILVFDFEFFIGVRLQIRRADSVSSCQPFEFPRRILSWLAYSNRAAISSALKARL
jgi:hypothetical protein